MRAILVVMLLVLRMLWTITAVTRVPHLLNASYFTAAMMTIMIIDVSSMQKAALEVINHFLYCTMVIRHSKILLLEEQVRICINFLQREVVVQLLTSEHTMEAVQMLKVPNLLLQSMH